MPGSYITTHRNHCGCTIALALLLLAPVRIQAQYQSYSIALSSGTSLPDYTLSPKMGYTLEGSFIYSPVRELSFSLDISKTVLNGEGNLSIPTDIADPGSERISRNFQSTTQLFVYGGSLMLNMHSLLSHKKPRYIVPSFIAGTGLADGIMSTGLKGSTATETIKNTFFTNWVGISTRIKLNHTADYLIKIQYQVVDTKYLELLQYDDKKDAFLTFTLGILLNYSGKSRRPHLHWTATQQKCPVSEF